MADERRNQSAEEIAEAINRRKTKDAKILLAIVGGAVLLAFLYVLAALALG